MADLICHMNEIHLAPVLIHCVACWWGGGGGKNRQGGEKKKRRGEGKAELASIRQGSVKNCYSRPRKGPLGRLKSLNHPGSAVKGLCCSPSACQGFGEGKGPKGKGEPEGKGGAFRSLVPCRICNSGIVWGVCVCVCVTFTLYITWNLIR